MSISSVLGVFAKIVKSKYQLHVRPSVFMEKPRFQLDGFSLNLIYDCFSKLCRENSSFIYNPIRIKGTLHEQQYTFISINSY
jgi:hypothetical protein